MNEELIGNAICKHCGARVAFLLTGEHEPGPDGREWWTIAGGSQCQGCGWAPPRFLEWAHLLIPVRTLELREAVRL
jgi:hypothetical protein